MRSSDDTKIIAESEYITLSFAKYEELLKAKLILALVKRAYMANTPFNLQDRLSLMFGPVKDGKAGELDAE